MAVVLGTSSGFVSSAPSADPGGSDQAANSIAWGQRDDTSATAETITEIGWYCNNAVPEGNFEVGIYTDDAGNTEPQTVVGSLSTTNAKGTDAGWKVVTGLNISVSSSTTYWICVQVDDTSPAAHSDYSADAGEKQIYDGGNTELPDPTWDIGGDSYSEVAAIYAVWEVGGTDYTETPSDGFSITDSLVRVGGQTISLSETLTILDNLITSGNMTIGLSDTQNLSDSLSSATEFNKLLDDIQSLTDSLSSQTEFKVLLDDLQSITDDLNRQVEYNVNLDDTINMTDDLVDTLTTLVRVLSKIYKLGLIKYDTILKTNELIKLGLIPFDNKLKSEKKITLKTDKGGTIKI